MIKRLSTAAICVAFVCASGAQAQPYFGFDGRNYGELPNAPNYGRQKVAHGKLDHKDAPRKCLKPEVRALLEKVEVEFGPVEVISTCRPGATIAGSGRPSRHASGNAVDFEAGNRKGKIIDWLVANHKAGGTMTYSNMSHIHIDIGQHFVSLAGGRKYASWSSGSRGSNSSTGSSTGSSKSSGKNRGYAKARSYGDGYGSAYSGVSSGYAATAQAYSGGYGAYAYEATSHGRQFSNGYATIYR
jgi:hypothetical protein